MAANFKSWLVSPVSTKELAFTRTSMTFRRLREGKNID
jgi:hypothetical protein